MLLRVLADILVVKIKLGSPVIALKALTEHSARSRMASEIPYLFIEKDKDRSQPFD